jgi:3'(2'), 5'-bisphosphate nucleotidase
VAELDDHVLARHLADRAGAVLLELRRTGHGTELGAAGDRAAHELLMRELRRHRPHDAVLSEEGAGMLNRGAERTWIIDPLDGTREYGETTRTDWAVHVALCIRHRVVAGAVALAALGVTLGTDDPPRLPARSPRPSRIRIAVSRSRPPAVVSELARTLEVHIVPMGSAGAKTAAVLTGEVEAYVHAGGQYEWDSAAPAAVALAAGAVATRLDGSPLRYNNPDPYLPDLLVCRPDVHRELTAALERVPRA